MKEVRELTAERAPGAIEVLWEICNDEKQPGVTRVQAANALLVSARSEAKAAAKLAGLKRYVDGNSLITAEARHSNHLSLCRHVDELHGAVKGSCGIRDNANNLVNHHSMRRSPSGEPMNVQHGLFGLAGGFAFVCVVFTGDACLGQTAFMALGTGADSCATWTRNSKNSVSETTQILWVEGFMSGLAQGTRRDLLRNIDKEALETWMDDYCSKHPLDRVLDAMAPLWLDLLQRQK